MGKAHCKLIVEKEEQTVIIIKLNRSRYIEQLDNYRIVISIYVNFFLFYYMSNLIIKVK